MTLRDHLQKLDRENKLVRVSTPVSKIYDIAAILKKLEPQPVLFEHVIESPFRVAGNLFCSKDSFATLFWHPGRGYHPEINPRHQPPDTAGGCR